jgi:hypothetical protein
MAIIQQNSRITFHTITATGSGSTFSVPSQEDFTSRTSPWTINDLCLSEIGVNEGDVKAYIRIGSDIKEFQFVGGTGGTGGTGSGGGENLTQTLAIGSTMSGYIYSPSNTNGVYVDDVYAQIFGSGSSYTSVITASPYQVGLSSQDLSASVASSIYIAPNEIQSQVGNSTTTVVESRKSSAVVTSVAGTSSLYQSNIIIDDQMVSMKVHIIGNSISPYNSYSGNLIATFNRYSGTTYQISTTDVIEKSSFGSGVTSTIETDGTDIFVKVVGDSSTINWLCMIDYIVG